MPTARPTIGRRSLRVSTGSSQGNGVYGALAVLRSFNTGSRRATFLRLLTQRGDLPHCRVITDCYDGFGMVQRRSRVASAGITMVSSADRPVPSGIVAS